MGKSKYKISKKWRKLDIISFGILYKNTERKIKQPPSESEESTPFGGGRS